MPFADPIGTLFIIIKGIFIGIIASAPMGPVGVLCIQRTLNKGRAYGLVTGIGASLSDIFYAMMTGFGMSFVMDFVTNQRNLFILQLVGSVMLFLFGIWIFRADHTGSRKSDCGVPPVQKKKGSLLHNFITAFLLTLSNPLIIFLFIALFARFAFIIPGHPVMQVIGYASIVCGAMIWWLGLTYVLTRFKKSFSERGVLLLNRTIGVVILLAALAGFVLTVTGLYSPYHN